MRGRTNIPPRVGGIVRGDIVTYQVQDVNGIGIGDYVQLIEGTGSTLVNSSISHEGTMFGPFSLSNGKPALFYINPTNPKLFVDTWDVKDSGISDAFSLELDTSMLSLQPGTGNNNYQQMLEIAQDEFLLILAYSTSSRAFGRIRFSNGAWSIESITEISEISLWQSSANWKWYIEGERVIVSSNGKIAIGYIEENSIDFSYVYSSSVSSPNGNGTLTVVNDYLVHIRGTQIETCEMLDDSIIFSHILSSSLLNILFIGDYTKISEDKLMFMYGQSTTYTTAESNRYFNAVIFQIGDDGSILESSIPNAVYFTSVGTSYAPTGTILSTFSKVLPSGKILIVALEQYRSSSTAYKYAIQAIHVCVCNYDSSNGALTFGKTYRTPVDFTPYQTDLYDLTGICVIEDNYIFMTVWNVSTSTRDGYTNSFTARIEQSSVVPLSKVPFVSNYRTEINGIAKTPGANGEAIEVYIPYRKEG